MNGRGMGGRWMDGRGMDGRGMGGREMHTCGMASGCVALADPGPAFHDRDALAALDRLDAAGLDALPFGVIRMDCTGIVTGYNAAESRLAGLSPSRVIGRHFFRHVAPCCDNAVVAGRYAAAELDVEVDYVFTLRMRPTPVRLRLLKSAGPHAYMLVRRD